MKHSKASVAFAIPSIIVYSVLLAVPILIALLLSFTSWNGIGEIKYIGFNNFLRIFKDKSLGIAIENTVLVTVVQLIICNVLGLFMAMLVNRTDRLTSILRTFYFIPYVLSSVAIAFVWKAIFAYNGVINTILKTVGLEKWITAFTSNRKGALICIIIVGIWNTLGYYMMIYLAALQSVPQELYEAAKVDGVNNWTKFWHITLPLITSGTMISVLMGLINGLKAYDIVKVMTDGGPGNSTETIVYSIVRYGSSNNMMGYASALAVALFLAIAVFTLIVIRFFRNKEVY
mgnify:FL=1